MIHINDLFINLPGKTEEVAKEDPVTCPMCVDGEVAATKDNPAGICRTCNGTGIRP